MLLSLLQGVYYIKRCYILYKYILNNKIIVLFKKLSINWKNQHGMFHSIIIQWRPDWLEKKIVVYRSIGLILGAVCSVQEMPKLASVCEICNFAWDSFRSIIFIYVLSLCRKQIIRFCYDIDDDQVFIYLQNSPITLL